MEWTQKLPTEPGYYWFSYLSWRGTDNVVEVVEVYNVKYSSGGIGFTLTDESWDLEWARDDWWWQGPLEEPEFTEAQ